MKYDKILENLGVTCHPVLRSDEFRNVVVVVNFDVFTSIIKANSIKSVFVEKLYIHKGDMVITDAMLSCVGYGTLRDPADDKGLDDFSIVKVRRLFGKDLEKFNKKGQRVDESIPILVTYLIFIQGGCVIFKAYPNKEYSELDVTAAEYLAILEGLHSKELAKILEDYKGSAEWGDSRVDGDGYWVGDPCVDPAVEDLKDYIFKDREFHKCTNQYLRKEYLKKLVQGNSEFIDVLKPYVRLNVDWKEFEAGKGCIEHVRSSGVAFIDDIWREYKDNSRSTFRV